MVKQALICLFFLATPLQYKYQSNGEISLHDTTFYTIGKPLGHLLQKYQLCMNGYGGSFSTNISFISISLDYYPPIHSKDATELYKNVVSEIQRLVNDINALRPYFAQYPLRNENFSISIYFENIDSDFNRYLMSEGKLYKVKGHTYEEL